MSDATSESSRPRHRLLRASAGPRTSVEYPGLHREQTRPVGVENPTVSEVARVRQYAIYDVVVARDRSTH